MIKHDAVLILFFSFEFQISKYDIEKSVEREMSGDLKNAMTTLGMIMYIICIIIYRKHFKSFDWSRADDEIVIPLLAKFGVMTSQWYIENKYTTL